MNHNTTTPQSTGLLSTAGQWSLDDVKTLALLDQVQEDHSIYEVNTDDGNITSFLLPHDPETQTFLNRLQLGVYCKKPRPLAKIQSSKDFHGNEKLIVQFAKDIPVQLQASITTVFSMPESGKYEVGIELEIIHTVIQELSDQERHILCTFHPNDRYCNNQAQDYVAALNHFQSMLNARMKSKIVRKRLYNRKMNRQNGKANCMALVNALLKIHSKLLIVRVDLGLMRNPESLAKHLVSPVHLASEHDSVFIVKALKRLNDNARHNRMKNALGYIHRIEYGAKKGFHVHAYYFFIGNDHQEDITWGQYIKQQWEHVTQNNGSAFICNMKKADYRYCSLGMLDYSDKEMLKNLEKSFDYICKNDQYFQFTTQKRIQGLRISEIPEIPEVKMGRPRKYDQSH